MNSIWHWLKDYFDLTNGERRGILLLLILVFLLVIFRYSLPYFLTSQKTDYDFTEIKQLAEVLENNQKAAGNQFNKFEDFSLTDLEKEKVNNVTLFSFDPNTATLDDFRKLGLSQKQSKTIINYRNKGGKFYKKEDLLKIYGLKPEQYQKLAPFINLPSLANPKKITNENSYAGKDKVERKAFIVEINTADSAELINLRGIGPAFASRILKYRSLLGGFVQKEQLREVYGLDSVKFAEIENQLKVNPQIINKININTTSIEALKKHPYIKYKLANAIIQYRQRHGNYKSVDELKKIYIMDARSFEKIKPYVVTE